MGFPNEDVDKLGNTGPRVRPYCTLQSKHNFEQVIGETHQHPTYLSTVNHVINVNTGQSLYSSACFSGGVNADLLTKPRLKLANHS